MRGSVPLFIPPMLAVRGEAFDSDDHWFEPKWDGIRCLLHSSEGIRLHSRNGRDITTRFPELTQQPVLDATDYLIDGELISLGPAGVPSFDQIRDRLLQSDTARIARSVQDVPAVFVAFDVLYCDGAPLLDAPLEERRAMLERRFVPGGSVRLSPVTPREGRALFHAMARNNMEGIVAKELGSPYRPGQRSPAWIKVRRTHEALFWVVGYTVSTGDELRSLAVADETADGLQYVGHVGSGLNASIRTKLLKLLADVPRADGADYCAPDDAGRKTEWLEPKMQVRVEYLERGRTGRLRHPVFRGIV